MQLKSIKMAGFKSFADPTVLTVRNRITAILGPNGCGKSNVVDAIRCVLSGVAKQLRGGSMPDIIFNGSANRKPVGQASVELVFDNSDGAIGGEYASYAEICVRRELYRDGQSNYFLNGVRCRRRDVVDLFLGTGLGPDSYAIIEQGMISKLIEAKPEELRIFLEEAAGISKYKERRRETESRIQHTRENLDRLNDHRLELDKQLAHLQRQAQAAEKYKTYKQEQRRLKADLQALHWRELEQQLAEKKQRIGDDEVQYEAAMADLRQVDAQIEAVRVNKTELGDVFNEVQGRYYSLGAEIARVEQQLQNTRERQQQLQADLNELERSYSELQQHYEEDQLQIEELGQELISLEPQLETAQKQITATATLSSEAEEAMQAWQQTWDEFNQQSTATWRAVESSQARQQHQIQTMQRLEQQINKITQEQLQLEHEPVAAAISELSVKSEALRQQLDAQQTLDEHLQNKINDYRQQQNTLTNDIAQARNQLQTWRGRHASLETLQQAALGKTDAVVNDWLQQQQLANQPRLAEQLQVEQGWEIAVETVLGSYLEAVCVERIADLQNAIGEFNQGHLTLIQQTHVSPAIATSERLANKVSGPSALHSWIANVYVADDLRTALQLSEQLATGESVITRDGIWLGNGWLRITKQTDAKHGIIQRERELQELTKSIDELAATIADQEALLAEVRENVMTLENERRVQQQTQREFSLQYTEVRSQLGSLQTKLEQMQQRQMAIAQELIQYQQQQQQAKEELTQIDLALTAAQQQRQQNEQHKQALQEQRYVLQDELHQARQQSQQTKQRADELQMRCETTRNQLQYLRQAVTRAEKQLADTDERRNHLATMISELQEPQATLQQELTEKLESRLAVEHELQAARQALNHAEDQLNQYEQQRQRTDGLINKLRNQLEQLRMQSQAAQIRQVTHQEKIVEEGFELEPILAELTAEANTTEYEEQINKLDQRIQRLGAINLAAIEECAQLEERKNYLEAQNNDLLEALATLENAIQKIDQESRERLQETYNKVNTEFNNLFQRVFGGGNATIELLGDDLLSTGMVVKAQPPGKRNSHIHLLSGGEKALTAVSLVFALFQLNPAPFCILDEVDAPLDDVNVGRFCNLVREMSSKVQFIFISHNKLTMEIAEQLVGVTMHEPGVSRLVSVDMAQALAMAEAA